MAEKKGLTTMAIVWQVLRAVVAIGLIYWMLRISGVV